jgi:hypothetical protein
MMPPNGDQADPQQEIQFLQGLLQDSQLIIGQQQVTLLRMRAQIDQQTEQIKQLSSQLDQQLIHEATVGPGEVT